MNANNNSNGKVDPAGFELPRRIFQSIVQHCTPVARLDADVAFALGEAGIKFDEAVLAQNTGHATKLAWEAVELANRVELPVLIAEIAVEMEESMVEFNGWHLDFSFAQRLLVEAKGEKSLKAKIALARQAKKAVVNLRQSIRRKIEADRDETSLAAVVGLVLKSDRRFSSGQRLEVKGNGHEKYEPEVSEASLNAKAENAAAVELARATALTSRAAAGDAWVDPTFSIIKIEGMGKKKKATGKKAKRGKGQSKQHA
ncbi:MAG: hypothetical protein AAB443_02700 [Patescibacteria group bacterium]